jgi:cellulose synthase/poly-beta-1,6-N-acetylglucosamine synthase-like glycosyltransferase
VEQSGDSQKRAVRKVGWANQLRPASTLTSSSLALIIALILGAGVSTNFDLKDGLRDLTIIVAWVSVLLGVLRLMACLSPRRAPAPLLPYKDLPRYTVILPLYHEAHMVQSLIASLSQLDYPVDRLDIILACEANDPDTVKTAQALARPPFRVLIVPPTVPGGPPQTKPRALNYALARSDAPFVTIFDAEDRPHPRQLRQAASAFASHPDWAALQAPLNYFNTRDSFLAAQFGLEYAGLFQVLLPFYDALDLPFPLGGTSNHMRGLM